MLDSDKYYSATDISKVIDDYRQVTVKHEFTSGKKLVIQMQIALLKI